MGPLAGLKVIEMAGIGPIPFAGMLLADMGAEVVRIDRRPSQGADAFDDLKSGGFLDRGRRSIALDLKRPEAVAAALALIESADALIEGFRPGVMERLGLGPEVCLSRNPRLVYGRVTGWGQEGPLAQAVGHDIDYIALTGALHAIGGKDAPAPPLNLLGDYGGGALFLAFGVVSRVARSARLGTRPGGRRGDDRRRRPDDGDDLQPEGEGLLARPTRDQRARRRRAVLWRLSLRRRQVGRRRRARAAASSPRSSPGSGSRRANSPTAGTPRLAGDAGAASNGVFAERTRDEWVARFAGADACVAPVLDLDEAPRHPHAVARAAFVAGEGATPAGAGAALLAHAGGSRRPAACAWRRW